MSGQISTLITGGAGFVGSNLADRLLSQGESVIIYDNLVRPGTEHNLDWLRRRYAERITVFQADITDRAALAEAVAHADYVYHFAAQVAVTSSLRDPLYDHRINVGGTLTLLETLRRADHRPPLIFTSTNKVYGDLEEISLRMTPTRYEPMDQTLRDRGIDESRPLSFCSPYGCSKGAADQYVLDYAKTFDLPTLCFRMSCIYGRRQFGNEDQGWVAHFVKQAVAGHPLTLYGDGLQVRDVLYADDLVDAFLLARARFPEIRGEVFNIGGGPANVLSLVELLAMIETLGGRAPAVRFEAWRPGDQRYYVSDTGKFRRATGWRPRVGVREGVERLYRWMSEEAGARPARNPVKASL